MVSQAVNDCIKRKFCAILEEKLKSDNLGIT